MSPTVVTLAGPFVKLPGSSDVTGTVMVGGVAGGDRPVRHQMVSPPCVAVTSPSAQSVEGVPEICKPAGRSSVNDHPVFSASSDVLVTVKVRLAESPV